MRYLLVIGLMILFGCRPNRNSVFKNYWVCKDGYHLGHFYKYKKGDGVAFCKRDCDSTDVYSIRVDDNFYVYKGKTRIAKITKCDRREMIIVSLDSNQEGYYVINGEK